MNFLDLLWNTIFNFKLTLYFYKTNMELLGILIPISSSHDIFTNPLGSEMIYIFLSIKCNNASLLKSLISTKLEKDRRVSSIFFLAIPPMLSGQPSFL